MFAIGCKRVLLLLWRWVPEDRRRDAQQPGTEGTGAPGTIVMVTEYGHDPPIRQFDRIGRVHGLRIRPTEKYESTVPIPRLTVVMAEHGLYTVVHPSFQLAHAGGLCHQDVAVAQRQKLTMYLAVFEVNLVIGPGFAVVHGSGGADAPPVVVVR